MDKAEYSKMPVEERVSYFNSELLAGRKLAHICRAIPTSDNISSWFKTKGYFRSDEEPGLFVKREPHHPGQISLEQLPQEQECPLEGVGINDGVINTQTGIEVVSQGIAEIPPVSSIPVQQVPKKIGRPRRQGGDVIKLTLELPVETHRALMIYRAANNLFANEYINRLLKENIPEKYFREL